MSDMNFQKPKGTSDILPADIGKWQIVESIAQQIFSLYNFKEIRTPIFEDFEVFSRSAGESSDIVQKEMYDFVDKGDRHLALRPEGTAGVVRSFVENKLYGPEFEKPFKVWYSGSMYRYERPQSGRQREFNQIGVEAIGDDSVQLDVQIIKMALDFFAELGLKNLKLSINSLGNLESRKNYRDALVSYLLPLIDNLSDDSKRRLDKNPLRILDSKDPGDIQIVAKAPKMIEFLDSESLERFNQLCNLLDSLDINYEIDTNLVRGLDYYNETVFEIIADTKQLGSQATIAGGGRYSNLIEEFGGPQTSAIGFAIGLERLISIVDFDQFEIPRLDAYIVGQYEFDDLKLKIADFLRSKKMSVDFDFLKRSVKAQKKTIDNIQPYSFFEIIDVSNLRYKDLESGIEQEFLISELLDNKISFVEEEP